MTTIGTSLRLPTKPVKGWTGLEMDLLGATLDEGLGESVASRYVAAVRQATSAMA
jgi:hypothetical protein